MPPGAAMSASPRRSANHAASGNCARNFNPVMATAGRVTIAEVEQLVPAGALEADQIHTPGIFVDRILQGVAYQKRIEKLTTRPREGASS